MSPLFDLFYLLIPMVLAGVFNMVFVKAPYLDFLKIPIDSGLVLKDGKRLFGDNKTWKGFFGMIFLTSFWLGVFGTLADNSEWAFQHTLMPLTSINSWFWGGIWGLAYVLAELPNSYVKRRVDIQPGKNGKGLIGWFFLIVDQSDSVIGCSLAMLLFYTPSIPDFFAIIFFSIIIHFLVNILLFLVGLKKQAG